MDKFNSVISQLKKINDEAVVSCYVPSVQRDVKFKPMTVAQQQQLIKGINSQSSDSLKINNAINDIIISNCLEEINFKIIDRESILLGYKLNDAAITASEKSNIEKAIDAIKQLKQYETEFIIDAYGISIKCVIPSFARDSAINATSINEVDEIKSNKAGDLVSVLYRYQILKFISSINIQDTLVSFENLNDVASLLTIVDNIPTDLNNAVLSYSTRVQNVFANLLKDKNIVLQTPTL